MDQREQDTDAIDHWLTRADERYDQQPLWKALFPWALLGSLIALTGQLLA